MVIVGDSPSTYKYNNFFLKKEHKMLTSDRGQQYHRSTISIHHYLNQRIDTIKLTTWVISFNNNINDYSGHPATIYIYNIYLVI